MKLHELIKAAFEEDLPNGDLTTDSLKLPLQHVRARLVAKEDLVLSGIPAFEQAFQHWDPDVKINWYFQEGQVALKDQTLALLEGAPAALLKAERVALNFLGHLTGIATLTRAYANQLEGNKTQILDTRKTLPGYRDLQKTAVRHGGGANHRMNLSEAILVKENHIEFAGGLKEAVMEIRQQTSEDIEVEVKNIEELKQAIELKVSKVLLDNMNDEQIEEAQKLIPTHMKTEASGGISLERVRRLSQLGIDDISVGALTHSAPCADLSLIFDPTREHKE